MIDRDEAVRLAMKFAAEDPVRRPVERVDEAFSMDGGLFWTVHLVPESLDLGDGTIAFDTPGIWMVGVSGRTGLCKWLETF